MTPDDLLRWFNRMPWSMVSKAALGSKRARSVMCALLSRAKKIPTRMRVMTDSVERKFQNSGSCLGSRELT